MRVIRKSQPVKGGRTECPSLYLLFRDQNGHRREFAIDVDEDAAASFGKQLQHHINRRAVGQPPDAPTRAWLAALSTPWREKLARIGLLDEPADRDDSLSTLIGKYGQHLEAIPVHPRHASAVLTAIRNVVTAIGAKRPTDITHDGVQLALVQRRKQAQRDEELEMRERAEAAAVRAKFLEAERKAREQAKKLGKTYRTKKAPKRKNKKVARCSITTSNHYQKYMKAFCNWLIDEGYLGRNPLSRARKLVESPDKRRTLTDDEEAKLLYNTWLSTRVYCGTTGPQRAILYRFALETAMRAGELRELRVDHIDLDRRTVLVRPKVGSSRPKASELRELRLSAQLARQLRRHLPAKGPAFNVPLNAAKMLRLDAKEARLDEFDAHGLKLEFHSLRHRAALRTILAGADAGTVQRMMRHSTVSLTLDYYTDATSNMANAVEAARSRMLNRHRATGNGQAENGKKEQADADE